MKKYPEYKTLDLPGIGKDILGVWKEEETFRKSLDIREGSPPFVFYEGPPSANGMPGIHHVMARTIKDLFCRYKTMKGYRVERRAGWDTHGLPVELAVEKELGITREDIGKTISIADYNARCREAVMKYTGVWNDLTEKMGYWVDMDNPYVTYTNEYIESVWWLLKQLYEKDLIYKGYTVQPYSPAAGTGLSSHELNLPGCYKEVSDTSVVAQFKVSPSQTLPKGEGFLKRLLSPSSGGGWGESYFLAWTTTPWTLPANCALAVGKDIKYVAVKTYNRYTCKNLTAILAKDLFHKYFKPDAKVEESGIEMSFFEYFENLPISERDSNAFWLFLKQGNTVPGEILAEFRGSDLEGIKYEQLLPYVQPDESKGEAFRVIPGDFVSTGDGTGIVHTASVFGADDFRVCKANNVPSILVKDENGGDMPLVDKRGRFVKEVTDFAGMYVRAEYYSEEDRNAEDFKSTDVRIAIKLKEENKAFLVEKYTHSYPHCWRTDKPVLYYPLNSWFVRTTAKKDRLIELNKTINWKPESTGSGRFGNWLENLQDWNLSRSRYWGTPLPVWVTKDKSEIKCIGSIKEMHDECEKSVQAGFMPKNPIPAEQHPSSNIHYPLSNIQHPTSFDLHRPYVDDIILVSGSGQPMRREPDLIDVWFDSGAMPYAQQHFPFGPIPYPSPDGKGGRPKYQTARNSVYNLLKKLQEERINRETEAEKLLWQSLKGKQLQHYKFRRQHIIDEFIIDFVCLSKKLVVEVDGKYHDDPDVREADQLRMGMLEDLGYKVVRFTNDEVLNETDSVLSSIARTLAHMPALPFGEGLGGAFPADFIAEGVDQTRGWFFTLHAIAVLLFDSVAFKNVVSNGLVLDKNGNKMSKRLGNAADPFDTIAKYGSDATRWYLITNAQPWDNLKFDAGGIKDVQRKFFGTLYNTYAFFALYANIDGFTYSEKDIPASKRPETDRWILSELNTLIRKADEAYADYEPTKAGRLIQEFVDEHLSNWYVRLSRRRFWKGDYSDDKIAAYQTLYACLVTVARLMAPVAPFYADRLFRDLNGATGKEKTASVHLSDFPLCDKKAIDPELEARMAIAQKISHLVLSIRKRERIRVRQPLNKVIVPVPGTLFRERLQAVEKLILAEVNVREMEYLEGDTGLFVKKVKPDFKQLGPRFGKDMKAAAAAIQALSAEQIATLEHNGTYELKLGGKPVTIALGEVEIVTEDVPGWSVAGLGGITVALDVTITPELKEEGIAREVVNRIQNLRKEMNFDVTDRIALKIMEHDAINAAITNNLNYICSETLAGSLELVPGLEPGKGAEVSVDDDISTRIYIEKCN